MQEIKNGVFFAGEGGVPRQYPWMSEDEHCEVAVIGGGTAGCFAAHALARAGVDTLLISQGPIGFTAALPGSSMLSYQNELLLTKLSKRVGKDRAIEVFGLCGSALDILEDFAREAEDFGFHRRDAFLCASAPEQANELHTEYLMRKHNGFEVEFLEKAEAGERFSFPVHAGILAPGMGGEVDGYRLCHALCRRAAEDGARIYENTAASSISHTHDGIEIEASHGRTIHAKKIVLAVGTRQEEYLRGLIARRTVFAVATAPARSFAGYESRALVRDCTLDVSLHTSSDDRIIASGLDASLLGQDGRIGRLLNVDRIAEHRYAELERCLEEMLVGIPGLAPEYAYRGVYGMTRDGLPLVGCHPDYDDIYFDLPASTNGVLFSLLGANRIVELYHGEVSEAENPFSPVRDSL